MTDSASLIRTLVIYGVAVPLAIMLGYLMATPQDYSSFAVVGAVLLILATPLLLRWHHFLLFLGWNMCAVAFFVPGRPDFWIFMAFASFLITIIQRALSPRVRMFPAPSVLWPLVFLLVVVVGTAQLTGGIHVNSLGNAVGGGRRYTSLIFAVVGFIAMTSHTIPHGKTSKYAWAFMLGNLTNAIGNLYPYLGSSATLLFVIFPLDENTYGTLTENSGFAETVGRNYGLSVSLCWAFYYMLARYGIRNLLSTGNFKKLMLTLGFFVFANLGGFRSFLILMLITSFFCFYFEGLFRSRYVILLVAALVCSIALMPFARHLPLSIQRSISVLPVEVDPVAQLAAESTSNWRKSVWRAVVPDIPKYFWLGKGLAVNMAEMETATRLSVNKMSNDETETAVISGDYHNGPLSVIIPFGIWGVIGWLWFLAAAVRALYLNHRNGEPELRTINCFLLSYFLAKSVEFFFVFGGFYSELYMFGGLAGLSISLNGGIKKRAVLTVRSPQSVRRLVRFPLRLAPGFRK